MEVIELHSLAVILIGYDAYQNGHDMRSTAVQVHVIE